MTPPPRIEKQVGAECVAVRKLWDEAPHRAFTDLVRYRERWYCCFREGTTHVSSDGVVRILASDDGEAWRPVAGIASTTANLGEPKLSLPPHGELMLTANAVPHTAVLDPASLRDESRAWFSEDGRAWTGGHRIGDANFCLGRVAWHAGTAYTVGYASYERKFVRLYRSRDGARWETLVENLLGENFPNEAVLLFLADATCLCLLRRDPDPGTCLLGEAAPPYTAWRWRDLGVRVGGPNVVQLPDGRLLAAGRLYDRRKRTGLLWLDRAGAQLEEFLTLPSGGDTSYPGLVWHDDLLWVSYYSTHEGKTGVYLATVRLHEPDRLPSPSGAGCTP